MNVTSCLVLACLLAVGMAPGASALGESCTVSSWFWHLSATCTGTFYENVYLSWCPNEPWIDCGDAHIFTCTVQTGRPILFCPLA